MHIKKRMYVVNYYHDLKVPIAKCSIISRFTASLTFGIKVNFMNSSGCSKEFTNSRNCNRVIVSQNPIIPTDFEMEFYPKTF